MDLAFPTAMRQSLSDEKFLSLPKSLPTLTVLTSYFRFRKL